MSRIAASDELIDTLTERVSRRVLELMDSRLERLVDRRAELDLRPPYGVVDLMKVTGLGRDTVRACIRSGELPGVHAGRQYTVPAQAFEDFCAGRWVPQRRPIFTENVRPLPQANDLIKQVG